MIERLVTGVIQENCYLLWDEHTKYAAVIDPGDDGDIICKTIESLSLEPIYIVNTHYHFDHTGANRYIKERYNVPIAIGNLDAPFLEEAYKAAEKFMIRAEKSPKADILLFEGDVVTVGNISLSVIHTPGHTKGSICLYSEDTKLLFSGDTLFYESVGRWDLSGGNKDELFESLEKLLNLPEDTVVYPGHGPETTIRHERRFNPYKKGVL